jgi:predicted DNA repair protein MutK
MATSLLLLLDDIASVLDDVATMTKVAAKKTAGVLGDDLALNAKQVTGVDPARELPVVWAVAKGSAVNKAILVPAALLISWLVPWAIPPLLILGGAFLCYEGAEKILHAVLHRGGRGHGHGHGHDAAGDQAGAADNKPAIEQKKITGAIRTDFILSAEIIVITLDLVAGKPLVTQVGVLVVVAILITIAVYGLVAAIVKLDDVGMTLAASRSAGIAALGRGIVAAAPWLMRALSVAGTAAMFFVGGGIIVHQLPAVHELLHQGLAWLGIDTHAEPTAALQLAIKSADALFGLALGLVIVVAAGLGRRAIGGLQGETA